MSKQNTTPQLDNAERTPCEIWSRVMGYYRPVSAWNTGKQSEQAERINFRLTPACTEDSSGQMKLGL